MVERHDSAPSRVPEVGLGTDAAGQLPFHDFPASTDATNGLKGVG